MANYIAIVHKAEKIVLLSGPGQVEKTTLSQNLTTPHSYLNYDAPSDRKIILDREWDRDPSLVIFDEPRRLPRTIFKGKHRVCQTLQKNPYGHHYPRRPSGP